MSGPQGYEPRHSRSGAPPSIFDAPPAGRAAAVASARELVAAHEAACNHPAGWDDASMARWCGRAAAVIGELTRDG